MEKNITAALLCIVLAGCTDLRFSAKERFTLEQRAIQSAIALCQKFGHKEDSVQFTRCAEQRYDEFLINNR